MRGSNPNTASPRGAEGEARDGDVSRPPPSNGTGGTAGEDVAVPCIAGRPTDAPSLEDRDGIRGDAPSDGDAPVASRDADAVVFGVLREPDGGDPRDRVVGTDDGIPGVRFKGDGDIPVGDVGADGGIPGTPFEGDGDSPVGGVGANDGIPGVCFEGDGDAPVGDVGTGGRGRGGAAFRVRRTSSSAQAPSAYSERPRMACLTPET